MWLIGIGVAHAGFAVGGVVGAEIGSGSVGTTESPVSFEPGPQFGLLVGYRADLVMLHLQPEVQALYSTVTDDVALNIGGAVTVLSPVAFGVAAHAGVAPGHGPRWDLLGVIELTMIPKIKPGVRAGVERISVYRGGTTWFPVVQGVVVIAF